MIANDFTSSISAKISPYEAIKRIGKVPEWWGVTFSGNSEKQNDQFEVKMSGDSFFNFTVTELIPGKRVVWLEIECYKECVPGWTHWIKTSLLSYFTTGKGDFKQPRD
jgi:hypothetical protein